MAAALDERTSAVLVSAVLFETAHIVPHLDELARPARRPAPSSSSTPTTRSGRSFSVAEQRLESAWIVGGGYKYLQLGEGNCFLRSPPQAERCDPCSPAGSPSSSCSRRAGDASGGLPSGGARFAGSTYDPTSHYRAARFFEERGLTPSSCAPRTSTRPACSRSASTARRAGRSDDARPLGPARPLRRLPRRRVPQAAAMARRLAEEGPDRRPRPLLPPRPGALPLGRTARSGDGASRGAVCRSSARR